MEHPTLFRLFRSRGRRPGWLALTADELAALDAASALPPEYPGWMVGFQNRDPRV